MDPINPIAGNPEALNQVEPRVQEQSPNRLSNITIFSMALFVLLSLGAVAFLYYQNQQLKGMLAKYQTPTPSSTPIATADQTANWKTFTDSKNTFSFKYPSNLSPVTNKTGVDFFDNQKNLIFSISLSVNTKSQINGFPSGLTQVNDSQNHTWNMISTNGIEGNAVYSAEYLTNSKYYSLGIWINEDNYAKYIGILSKPSNELAGGENKLVNQILSTFKFLGTNSNLKQETFSLINKSLTFSHPSNNIVFNDNLLVFTDFTQKLPSPPEDTVVFQTSDTKIDTTGNLIIKNTTIDSKPTVISENCGQVGEISNYCQTFIDINLGNSYLRLQIPSALYKNTKFIPIFNQLLSTFKFQ